MYHRTQLIGKWYRTEQDDSGELFTEFAEITADGHYEFTFLTHDEQDTVVQESVEIGDWGLVGDIHFTLCKSEFCEGKHYAADLADEGNYHAYRVLTLDSQVFQYQHILTNEVFILHRVIDNIALS
ncbi:hypothetical protein SAMN05216262_11740 [Colwellia chukchiensis]|uniref:Lipocalin-like domain-containing protein n=1 Tax=Colwellia chukchiensis TaxID=641665 RepID=A0A1H7S6F6_9GAMM|nr:hypothetical protein [Colwellia chukchiensis]SEL67869.1 hypothetical protein SAMN05216262_11740 [Colwellia chukchiensis]